MEGIDPAEVGLVALTIIVIGALISIVIVALSRRRERLRHKRVSTSRRNAATAFDLTPAARPGSSPNADEASRRSGRSSRHRIDFLGGDQPDRPS